MSKYLKILTLAVAFSSYFVSSGSVSVYHPPEPAEVMTQLPCPTVNCPPERECPEARECPQVTSCCNISPWVGEFYFNECDIIFHGTEVDSDDLSNVHLQHSMSYFQRYIFNKKKRTAYCNSQTGDFSNDYSQYHQDYGHHPYDPHRNTFGIYLGIESVVYVAKLFEDPANIALGKNDAHASWVDIHLGLSYQFRFWRKMLHALDIGGYYGIATTPFNVDSNDNNPIAHRQVFTQNSYGIYAAIPTYVQVLENLGLGLRIGIKYDLENRTELDDTAFFEYFAGLALRFQFDYFNGDRTKSPDYKIEEDNIESSMDNSSFNSDIIEAPELPQVQEEVIENFQDEQGQLFDAGFDSVDDVIEDAEQLDF